MRDYLEFFALRDDPFKITPDASYFFLSESHQEALSSLRYLAESEEGFAVVIGEPGTGKTLTVRKFIDELPQEKVKFAYVLFPNLSPEELFEAILEDFGIKSEGETKNRLFAKMRDFLVREREAGKKVIIIIDEAQNLPTETLEELRILSNLETSDLKLLQIILLGQPELEEKLNSKELRQLKQRITVFVKLRNFTEDETKSYIDYRIVKAGRGNVRIHPKTYSLVYRYSLGIPRLINILMERALMAAFVDTSHEIKPEHVERAAESIGIRVSKRNPLKTLLYTGIGGLVVAGLLLLGAQKLIDYINLKSAQETSYLSAKAVDRQPEKQKVQLGDRVVVNVPMLNMREKPDPESPVVYVLREGDELRVIERGEENWIKVLYSSGDIDIEGWVNGKYVR
ncbi:general secretion pathway protein A [Hydrogenivirga caldilitoris]|uniref:General secretion pathway protein A n=1 Tax=Hydrogenivirga caldilitoris TaxID=246264 RepID=A0A497XT85_9AQUI|nr:AAA family ATPase [Hydrogenivirga caldilitoris]RLJ70133.1 general secretion pathway protein A [Hydrogenivirga caldilitoris]